VVKNMNEVLAQIILAAREKKGWGNILFIVFIALFWAIGGILKATRAKKAEEQEAGVEELSQKPEGKPAEGIKGLPKGPFQKIRLALEAELQNQRQLQAKQAQRKLARPQPAAQKVTAKTESAAQIPALQPVEKAKLGPLTRQVGPKLQELPEFTTKAIKEVGAKRVSAPAEIPQVKHLAEILLDYSDPNELKRAILHYEILGKPLSLRGPSGHIM
jgi:hypothetical protein